MLERQVARHLHEDQLRLLHSAGGGLFQQSEVLSVTSGQKHGECTALICTHRCFRSARTFATGISCRGFRLPLDPAPNSVPVPLISGPWATRERQRERGGGGGGGGDGGGGGGGAERHTTPPGGGGRAPPAPPPSFSLSPPSPPPPPPPPPPASLSYYVSSLSLSLTMCPLSGAYLRQPAVPSGKIGKLRIHQSGKVTMLIGDIECVSSLTALCLCAPCSVSLCPPSLLADPLGSELAHTGIRYWTETVD
eukprot:COSAG03_NODE_456_length_7759_cov_122.878068_3_plen_250_part_00